MREYAWMDATGNRGQGHEKIVPNKKQKNNAYAISVDLAPLQSRARICKRLWSPGINYKEPIQSAYVG